MNRRVPLFRRFAVVSHAADGTVVLHSACFTHGGAVVKAVAASRAGEPVLSVAPTDWAPWRDRRAALLRVLVGRGEVSSAVVSRLTALSPWCVEMDLLTLEREGWVVLRAAGDPAAWRMRMWRLRTPEEMAGNRRGENPP